MGLKVLQSIPAFTINQHLRPQILSLTDAETTQEEDTRLSLGRGQI